MSFEAKRVLITGSTRGIGLAAARCFLERGARVAINGRKADEVAATITHLGGERLVAAPGCLGSASTCHRVVEAAVRGLGGLDILVNNAGVYAGASADRGGERRDFHVADGHQRQGLLLLQPGGDTGAAPQQGCDRHDRFGVRTFGQQRMRALLHLEGRGREHDARLCP